MEEQGHSRDGEAGPPAVEMVVLTGVHGPLAASEAVSLDSANPAPLIIGSGAAGSVVAGWAVKAALRAAVM